jgi:hypothetical protein
MKQRFTLFILLLLPVLFCGLAASGQEKKDSVPSRAHNAGFDVIIKRNGDLVYGLVQEVGPVVIRYKRTDIPDGPIYMLDRREIYAISYRNQVKEVLNPLDGYGTMPRTNMPGTGTMYPDPNMYPDRYGYPPIDQYNPALYPPRDYRDHFSFSRMGMLRFGLGFFRGYTKVEDADDYNSSTFIPAFTLAYEVLFQQGLRLGVQAGFGNRKFSRQEFNDYDSLLINKTLRENIFTLHAYGRYTVGDVYSRIQPYLMGGIGLQTSSIKTDQQIDFMEQYTPMLQVKSTTRSTGIGILLRAGAEYYLNPQIRVFADAGTGPAVVQVGVGAYLQQ